MITSSPASNKTWKRLYIACLAPFVTIIFSNSISKSFWIRSLFAIAFRRSKLPAAGPYFVNPSNIALLVASITSFGALKSGYLALKLQISTPSAANWFALALICSVSEGSIESARSDKFTLLIDLLLFKYDF